MNRDTIKMLAMATMLVNHIANVFMPAGAPLTNLCLYIGYFTAVTMCYFLVEGYGYTHSKTQYAGRLFGFAVLAQLPYQLVFPEHGMAGMLRFNMLFTLLLCFLVLAPVFTLLFAWAENSRLRKHVAFGVAAVLYGGMAWLSSMRTLGAVGALPDTLGCAMPVLVSGFFILYLYNGQRAAQHRGFYKWFFYAFYPGHLLVLGLLRVALLG